MVGGGLIVVLLWFSTASSQFKSTVEPRQSVTGSLLRADDGGILSGLFNPNNFSMHHSFSLSYLTGGGQGLSMGVYTNSMMFKFSDDLDVRADISLMASPYNTLGKQYQSSLSGLFLNRAELNYRPWKNTLFQIQYFQLPATYFMGYGYSRYGNNFFDGIDRYQEATH
jgi:hypothetical protein